MTAGVTSRRELETEVLIVGGGLVGGVLACALAAAGIRSVTVEAQAPRKNLATGFDGRVSAVARGSQCLFEALGLWPMMAGTAAPIRDIRVSEGGSSLFLHFDRAEGDGAPFGWMVENRALRQALNEHVGVLPGSVLLAPARVAALMRDEAGVRARLADGREIRARLAVAADGRNSETRRRAGIPTTGWPYRSAAIVCTVAHEHPHGDVAHEHFLPNGPFAILPRAGRRSSVVWTERADLVPALMALPEADFAMELGRRFGDFLGRLRTEGPRWSYPLAFHFARRATDTRLALVGDSLHGMHPIAGQGLNMGLRDAAALAEVLAEAKAAGEDLGGAPALACYARWRHFDNGLMLAATDLLDRLFSNDFRPLRLARTAGMALWGRVAPLKRLSTVHAMGTLGEVPRLMRGVPPDPAIKDRG